ncbi:MAG: FG-GAP repeat domain-containing protein [Pirellulales bacterium]
MRQLSILSLLLLSSICHADDAWKKHVVQPGSDTKSGLNSAVASDFDNDGHIDILGSFDGKVVLFYGPNRTPVTVYEFEAGKSRGKPRTACIHSCLLDVDGDSDMDLCGSNNTVFWLECPDEPTKTRWTYRNIDDEILGTHCLITGDVDQDGKLDLIANSGRDETGTTIPNSLTWLSIPNNPKQAKAWDRHIFANKDAPGGSHYTGIGDLNGDGRPDIACGAKGGEGFPGGQWFAWWEQPANATQVWQKHMLSGKEPGATNIHPIDLNGDKHLDLFATRGHGQGVLWFKGPKFEPIEIQFPHCLVTVDLDGDGDIDAATCGKEVDGVAVWYENDGKANFTKHVIGKNQGSYDIRAVDLDDDQDLDLLIAGHVSKNIVWYKNPLH